MTCTRCRECLNDPVTMQPNPTLNELNISSQGIPPVEGLHVRDSTIAFFSLLESRLTG
jgi:hypothetical protein